MAAVFFVCCTNFSGNVAHDVENLIKKQTIFSFNFWRFLAYHLFAEGYEKHAITTVILSSGPFD